MADPADQTPDHQMPPVPPAPEQGPVELDWVGMQLRAMYAEVVSEPLPDALQALLAALDVEPRS